MKKRFNISGDCKPKVHYMVDIDKKLTEIKKMIDHGDYFTINRARQYGKTTILKGLCRFLQPEYLVISLDFQRLSHKDFEKEDVFVAAVCREILKKLRRVEEVDDVLEKFQQLFGSDSQERSLSFLFDCFNFWCETSIKPIVLMIDEVDSATNNQVFLDFLAQLRFCYIERDEMAVFQSVILAGVYDIKYIKQKLEIEEHKRNSPWNIAADFLVDLSFSVEEIVGMLQAYEKDYQTGMELEKIATLLYDYTSGYPYLVSYLCKILDERLSACERFHNRQAVWTKEGVLQAVSLLLTEQNTLFDSLFHKLEEYQELKALLYQLLFQGKEIAYVVGVRSIEMALMFGLVKKEEQKIVIVNRIFEMLLYNLFLAEPKIQKESIYEEALKERNQFIKDGHLDMELVLKRFAVHFQDLYGDQEQQFLEEDGRRYFLLYLRPIINGTGNYYIESRTRNMERTDIIVDYKGEQFVIEMKIWRGNAYHERGEQQLLEYLDAYHLEKGYMVSFNFNKKKQCGVRKIQLGERILIEATV